MHTQFNSNLSNFNINKMAMTNSSSVVKFSWQLSCLSIYYDDVYAQ